MQALGCPRLIEWLASIDRHERRELVSHGNEYDGFLKSATIWRKEIQPGAGSELPDKISRALNPRRPGFPRYTAAH